MRDSISIVLVALLIFINDLEATTANEDIPYLITAIDNTYVATTESYLITIIVAATMRKEKYPFKGGLAMTFDDRDIEGWYGARNIFSKYNSHVTFFLSYPHLIGSGSLLDEMLHTLEDDGHEIASHAYSHNDALEYDSMQDYLDDAIVPHTQALIDLGFNRPTSFAYPFGRHSEEFDIELLKYYNFVRATDNLNNSDKIFYSSANSSHLLYSASVDEGRKSMELILKALERAKANDEILILHAHKIRQEVTGVNQISHDRLESILKEASDLGLEFYTISKLPDYK